MKVAGSNPVSRSIVFKRPFLLVLFLLAFVGQASSVAARETYFHEGAIVGSSLGILTANLLFLTTVNCDPSGDRDFCPGGKATAALMWGGIGSVAGLLVGSGIGALVKKPSYEVQLIPWFNESRYGVQLMAHW